MLIILPRKLTNRLVIIALIVLATWAPPMALAISVHVSAGMTGMLAVAICWFAIFLDASIWMFIALGRNGTYQGMERLRSAAWRGAVIGAPLLAFCLGLPPDYEGIVDLTAATVSAMIGGFLWFHAIEG